MNQRFQKQEYPKLIPFKTEKKGIGLQLGEDIKAGTFVIEYVGEVVSADECFRRMKKNRDSDRFYFLSLDGNEFIDAQKKGNLARFINHSCRPNCVTQKW